MTRSLIKTLVLINIGFHIVTGYCSCNICTGGSTVTASGNIVHEELTIAAPREIPFGTGVVIDNHIYETQDRTAKRYDGRYDIYFKTHQEAVNFALHRKEVKITCLMDERELLQLNTQDMLVMDR